jgi:hypothetical protein
VVDIDKFIYTYVTGKNWYYWITKINILEIISILKVFLPENLLFYLRKWNSWKH